MNWDCQELIAGNNEVILPCDFTSQLLAIEVTAGNQQPNWHQAGYLQSFVDIDGLDFVGNNFLLKFGRQLIEVPYLSYRLSFQPKQYLQNTAIKVRQLSTSEIRNISMTISFPNVTRATGPDVVTTLNASAVAQNALQANPDRAPGSFIINNASKTMWVTETGVVAVTSAPAIPIPVGGVFDFAPTYTGLISIIFVAGTTGSVQIHEFSYI